MSQTNVIFLGGIQQLCRQNFAIFKPPSLGGQFLYPERGQIQTFSDPLSSPPHPVYLVIEWHQSGLKMHF